MRAYRVKRFLGMDAYAGIDGMVGSIVAIPQEFSPPNRPYQGRAWMVKRGPSSSGHTFIPEDLPSVGGYLYFAAVELEEIPDDQA